jgi:GH43 family beta-xylosidase
MRASGPLGPYTYLGQLTTPGNHWSIDPSQLRLSDGQLYLFWSGWPGRNNGRQNIYIARMSEPWRIVGPRVMLSTPTYPWELRSGRAPVKVNESPEPIVHGGEVSVTYAASGCWTAHYSLGLLSAATNADLMRASSWTKARHPLFDSNPRARIYGPASNGWFTSPDGHETWIAFDAVNDPAGNCGQKRQAYAQPITWNADGTPNLGGSPVPRTTRLRVPSGDPGSA